MTLAEHPEKIGPYRIEERLGQGGMGTVYRAYDERLRRHVALKQIHPERSERPGARERFLREARAAARLNHPALVHLHDIVEADDGDWIVMELVEGTSLAGLLKNGPLTPPRALALAREIAGGLAAAHEAGILHRDLKTENVVITHDGHAKVLDFGLSKTLEGEDKDATLTGDGNLVGTPRAMSPEQAQGKTVDHRSDLFSLGTLLYEMVTGLSPFLGPGPAETLAKVCHHEQDLAREHAPDIPSELSELIDRLLAKQPAARPASTAEVSSELEQLARDARDEPATAPAVPAADASMTSVAETMTEGDEPFQFQGERRQLTLLCCELTGTALDPELLFEVLPAFQNLTNAAIERYEGHLQDLQGHRFVATFGYPRSHEDNTRRAVLAALEIVSGSHRFEEQGMTARAGVHSGPAVILSRGMGEHLALGETLDLATTLQEQADPGSVLMSTDAQRLVAGFFEEENTGKEETDALPPIGAFRVVAARNVTNRVEASDDLTSFIGRERELDLLTGRFELAREGAGQAALIAGEAGVGKTRLLSALRERLAARQPRWVVAYGSPYARNLPLHPVGGLLRGLLEIDADRPAQQQLARLAEALAEQDFLPEETMPLFTALLGLPGGNDLNLSEIRRETLEVVPALLQEMAEHRSLVVAFEDLHQIDSMTLDLISRLIDGAASSSLLLILTCRQGFRPPWGHRAQLTQLRLGPLENVEVGALIDALSADGQLSTEVRRRIVARAQGIPLFAEEIVGTGSGLPEPETIPASLHDGLATRLDRLGTARDVARIAAALDQEISHAELAAVSTLDEATLGDELDRLLSAEVLSRRPGGPPGYFFPRVLVRETAGASLLAEDRARLRRRLAVCRKT